jgi:hypothetical protein
MDRLVPLEKSSLKQRRFSRERSAGGKVQDSGIVPIISGRDGDFDAVSQGAIADFVFASLRRVKQVDHGLIVIRVIGFQS